MKIPFRLFCFPYSFNSVFNQNSLLRLKNTYIYVFFINQILLSSEKKGI